MSAEELSPTQRSSLRIFPLHGILYDHGVPACTCSLGTGCKSIGKHPMVRWRHHEEGGRGPSGGYGIQTGSFNGIFVVDLDVSPDKNGVESLLALGTVPDTLSVLTPSGGVHLYFRMPEGVYIPTTRGVVGRGIDIKGDGGFVVGPGSPHKLGGTYEEVPGELADPPAWLLALVVKELPAPKTFATEHYTVNPASPKGEQAISWAKAYLTRAEPAVEGQGGSDRLFAVCCHLMYSALPLDVLRQLVEEIYNPRCVPPWSRQEIEHKLEDADREADAPRGLCSPDFLDRMYSRTKNTGPKDPDPLHEYTFEVGMRSTGETRRATFGEICADLFDHKDWAGVLMFDTFRQRVIAVDPPVKMDAEDKGLSDSDIQRVRAWFEYHGKTLNPKDIQAAINVVARSRTVNAVQDWLQSLVWDGVPRLDRVLPDYFQSPDTPYERGIGPRWFISLVARAMSPGVQADCTLILEGEQYAGKTRAFRSLVPDPRWYAETSGSFDTKDFLENLRGIWIMGFDELASLSRASLEKVKTVLTVLCDHYRKSYGHEADDYPRSNGFCGTTNASHYLNDPTGARRFWPSRVLRAIDTAKIERDRDQLWAEAFARWKAGEAWHVNTPELRALCEAEQEDRFEVDSWEEIILRWFHDPTKFSHTKVVHTPGGTFHGVAPFDGSEGFTTADVLRYALDKPPGQQTRADTTRVGAILRRLKLETIRVTVGGHRERRYLFLGT